MIALVCYTPTKRMNIFVLKRVKWWQAFLKLKWEKKTGNNELDVSLFWVTGGWASCTSFDIKFKDTDYLLLNMVACKLVGTKFIRRWHEITHLTFTCLVSSWLFFNHQLVKRSLCSCGAHHASSTFNFYHLFPWFRSSKSASQTAQYIEPVRNSFLSSIAPYG